MMGLISASVVPERIATTGPPSTRPDTPPRMAPDTANAYIFSRFSEPSAVSGGGMWCATTMSSSAASTNTTAKRYHATSSIAKAEVVLYKSTMSATQASGGQCRAYQQAQIAQANVAPLATFFAGPECGAQTKTLAAGDYPDLVATLGFWPKSAWIPPHVYGVLYRNKNLVGTSVDFVVGITAHGPAQVDDLFGAMGGVLPQSARLVNNEPWSDYLLGCCQGTNEGGVAACGGFWKSESEENTGLCDGLMARYCAANPSKDICACYGTEPLDPTRAPDDPINRLLAHYNDNPKCRGACITKGYVPRALKAEACPPVNICNQSIGVGGSMKDSELSNLQQTCTIDSGSQTSTVGGADGPSGVVRRSSDAGGDDQELETAKARQSIVLLVLVVVVVAAVVAAVIAASWSASSQRPYGYNQPHGQPYGWR